MGQKGAWPSRGEDSELLGQGFVQINAIIPHAGHVLRASGRRAKGCVSGTSPVVHYTHAQWMEGRWSGKTKMQSVGWRSSYRRRSWDNTRRCKRRIPGSRHRDRNLRGAAAVRQHCSVEKASGQLAAPTGLNVHSRSGHQAGSFPSRLRTPSPHLHDKQIQGSVVAAPGP